MSAETVAQECTPVHEGEGLIFDAGSYPAPAQMEQHLETALRMGVEKVVLFPHFGAQNENTPQALEELQPDLVLRGNAPWSKAAAVVWPGPGIQGDLLGALEQDLQDFPDRKFLLSEISRFSLTRVSSLVREYPNLWLGLGPRDLVKLKENCARGPLQSTIDKAAGRVVFTSFGLKSNWASYKNIIANLRTYSALLSHEQSEAILFRNAEELYHLAVNAP